MAVHNFTQAPPSLMAGNLQTTANIWFSALNSLYYPKSEEVMMKYVLNTLLLMTAIGVMEGYAGESTSVANRLWAEYGYIVISVVLLVVVAVVLAKTPARKLNE